jgi:DNA-binding response OmpR family regulator
MQSTAKYFKKEGQDEMKILVIEDDLSVRETLGMVLESSQHHVDLIENGKQALEYLAETWPDVMLLDLTLPEMSGEEVYQEIHNRFGKTPPTVIVSAAQKAADRAKFMPGALFLAKPYTIEDLEDVLLQISHKGAA